MNLGRIAIASALTTVALVGGSMATASADTASHQQAPAGSNVGALEEWSYTGEDFYWQSDCSARAQELLTTGEISKYRCDGSSSPFDEYSLFVVWK